MDAKAGRQEQSNNAATLRQNENTIQWHSQIFLMNGAHHDVQKITIGLIMVWAAIGQDVSISRVI
jgi:hypothetical protein